MPANEWNVEAIVREVIRRLQSNSTDDFADGQSSTARSQVIPKQDGQLVLNERVVSMASLADKLEGIQCIVHSSRAVITPLARDELKQRGIATKEQIGQYESEHRLIVGVAVEERQKCEDIRRQVGQAIDVDVSHQQDLEAVVRDLARQVVAKEHPVALATGQPALAICMANRYSCLRAVQATTEDATRNSVESVGANLLVIDPAAIRPPDMANILRVFIGDGYRRCPQHLRSTLEQQSQV